MIVMEIEQENLKQMELQQNIFIMKISSYLK